MIELKNRLFARASNWEAGHEQIRAEAQAALTYIEELEQSLALLERRYQTRKLYTHAIMYGFNSHRIIVDQNGNISGVML
jgi:hypothetical protein